MRQGSEAGELTPGVPPIRDIYDALFASWGPQGWWPARTRLEMIVGAILTQNTAWTNVEKAIDRLRREDALRLDRLHSVALTDLAEWIRPARFLHVKARRLRAFTTMVYDAYGGSLHRLCAEEPHRLRTVLLDVSGIGPETADSILLYAAGYPFFVVDAYTRRFLQRHGWIRGDEGYDDVAALFTRALSDHPDRYGDYHALIVALGKKHCRATPDCASCPLQGLLPPGGVFLSTPGMTGASA